MRREVHLPHGGAVQNMVRCPRNGGAVRGQRELERRLFKFLEVMRESRVQRRLAENMEKNVLRSDFLRTGKALFKKCGRHEFSWPARIRRACIRDPSALRFARTGLVFAITAGAKTAA